MSEKGSLRIAMIAPPFGDTGGPEVVTQNLTDALLELGQEVTLFAPMDWKTKATHIPTLRKSLWNMKNLEKRTIEVRRNYIISSQIAVLGYQGSFDIIHLHSQRYAYSVAKNTKTPCLLSFHNKITDPIFKQIKEASASTVALSAYQKGSLRTSAVIHNGVPINKIKFSLKKGSYLIAIGRLDEQKGIDTAIKIAKKANKKLLIFGRRGSSEKRKLYFKDKIEPFLNNDTVIYKDQVDHKTLMNYLREAEALLFTIRRPEVCPMVIMESLACGTPVIGTLTQPLPELLPNKQTAFLSDNENELVEAVKKTHSFDRKKCRKYAEKNFDSIKMAKKYLALYKKILK